MFGNEFLRSFPSFANSGITLGIRNLPFGRNFRNESEEKKIHTIVKRYFFSGDSFTSRRGWNVRTFLVNLAVLNLTCKSELSCTCVCVHTAGWFRNVEAKYQGQKSSPRRAPVPASQFVTDEAIGNKQQGDSNCLSFSAVVHWMLSSR